MAQGLTINFTVHANPLKNGDGETTATDISMIVNHLAGL